MAEDSIHIQVSLPGREELDLVLGLDGNNQITKARLHGIGEPQLLALLQEWRPKLKGELSQLEVPQGTHTSAILMRELVLRAKGEWTFPYNEDELCHCRAIDTKAVDMAVITGAHTPEKVSELTSASTACGTCHPDVEAIIKYRLGQTGS